MENVRAIRAVLDRVGAIIILCPDLHPRSLLKVSTPYNPCGTSIRNRKRGTHATGPPKHRVGHCALSGCAGQSPLTQFSHAGKNPPCDRYTTALIHYLILPSFTVSFCKLE